MRSTLVAAVIAAPFAVGMAMAAPTVEGEKVLTFADKQINESSGLVAFDDLVVTVNDSGDSARIFAVALSGETSSVISHGGSAIDVEALAPAASEERAVWVADIGDNLARRSDLSVIKVPLDSGTSVTGERYAVNWEGGSADAETLMVHPNTGQMYAVTKAVVGGEILKGPASLSASGKNTFTAVGDAPALITDGAFFADGKHFILRNYGAAYVFETASLNQIGVFDLPVQKQGEGIAITPSGEVWISTEGVGTDVLRAPVPEEIASVVGIPNFAVDSSSPASPSAGESESAAAKSASGEPGMGQEEQDGPAVLPWVLGGLAAVVLFGVLIRSLRPH